jgi:5-hydroxyisourate hydrolase
MAISTHVLDTERGEPAPGVPVVLSRREGGDLVQLSAAETDGDGRVRELLGGPLQPGGYQLAFDVAAYFQARKGDVPFLSRVAIDFQIADADRHYHIPLLLSPYACASYRGS